MSLETNTTSNAKTWLITGASSGLGHALATYALEQGDRVVMGARTMSTMSALASRHGIDDRHEETVVLDEARLEVDVLPVFRPR